MAKENDQAELVGSLVVEASGTRMLEVVELEGFGKDARSILGESELDRMVEELGTLRQLGTVIQDTNGLRKFRWAAKGKGKRGGARVIYYYGGDHMPIFLIAIYSKSEKADMTKAEKKAATKLVNALKDEYHSTSSPPRLRVIQGQKKVKGRR